MSDEISDSLYVVDLHWLSGWIDSHLDSLGHTDVSSYAWLEEYTLQRPDYLLEFEIVRKPEPPSPFGALERERHNFQPFDNQTYGDRCTECGQFEESRFVDEWCEGDPAKRKGDRA